jgi:hypothetical protein
MEITGCAPQRDIELVITAVEVGGLLLPAFEGVTASAQCGAKIGARSSRLWILQDECLDDSLQADALHRAQRYVPYRGGLTNLMRSG